MKIFIYGRQPVDVDNGDGGEVREVLEGLGIDIPEDWAINIDGKSTFTFDGESKIVSVIPNLKGA